jgi:hypothetical protein
MAAPRLVKAACPQCGAGLHIDPGATVVTCDYCKLSSFIQTPESKRAPPDDGQQYGTIHIDPRAGQALVGVYVASGALVLFMGFGAAVAASVRATVTPPSPTSPPARDPFSDAPGSPACEKAVACCKVSLGGSIDKETVRQTCNAHRMMSDADCVKQLPILRQSAQALHRTCK